MRSVHFESHRTTTANSSPSAKIGCAGPDIGILRPHRDGAATAAADVPAPPSIFAPRAPFLAQLMSSSACWTFPAEANVHCYEAANDLTEQHAGDEVATV